MSLKIVFVVSELKDGQLAISKEIAGIGTDHEVKIVQLLGKTINGVMDAVENAYKKSLGGEVVKLEGSDVDRLVAEICKGYKPPE